MNAEVATIKTAAETALAQAFALARETLPGSDTVAAQRDAAFDVFAKAGLPHRRIEDWKYTDLRALMRDAKPLGEPARCRGQGARQIGRRLARRCRGASHCLRRRRVRCGIVRSGEFGDGPYGGFAGASARRQRSGARRASRQARAGKRRRGRAQYRLDGRRRRDPHRRRLDHRTAAAFCFVASGNRPRRSCARWSSSSRARARS